MMDLSPPTRLAMLGSTYQCRATRAQGVNFQEMQKRAAVLVTIVCISAYPSKSQDKTQKVLKGGKSLDVTLGVCGIGLRDAHSF
eukprot:3933600-Amphidinium_carterae.1